MKRHLYILLTLNIALLVWSCGDQKTTATVNEPRVDEASSSQIVVTQAQFDQRKMILGKFEDHQFPKVISANGMIDVPPENRAVVNATMGGYIKTAPLLIGDRVTKGQVLVTIENPEFVTIQQQYMEVNEQLTYLKAEYDRQTTMKAENITSQKSFLKAESDYKSAVARHTGLAKQLQMLHISPSRVASGNLTSVATIYAPISGSITKVHITRGSYVSPASEILEIVDNDHIHLELSVFEKDIMSIKKGQKIDFKIPEASDEIFKAEVHLVGTALESNRTIKVHGHLMDEDNHNFLTGMFVDALIITDTILEKALPSETIVDVDSVSYVLVLDRKEGDIYYFNPIEVDVLKTYNGFNVIKKQDTITLETQFLTKGAFNLLGE